MRKKVLMLLLPAAVLSLAAARVADEGGAQLGSERTARSSCGPFIMRYPADFTAMAGTVEKFLCESTGTVANSLGLESVDTITVLIAPDAEGYRRLHGGRLHEWSTAFSDIRSQFLGINSRAVVRMRRPVRTVIRHELSHLLFTQRVRGVRCPTWFLEGLAVMQSGDWGFDDQWRLVSQIVRKEVPYLEDLAGQFPQGADDAAFAYGISYIAVQELLRERPEDLVTLTAFIRDLGDFNEAFATTFGESTDHFDGRLHSILGKRYRNIGVMMQTAPYWLIVTVLFLLAFASRKYRNRRRLEKWERMEAEDV